MQILERLEDFVNPRQPVILTIGNFDGMHRGHCSVLKLAQSLTNKEGEIIVLTFRNHPSEVLHPDHPTQLLLTLPHKLHLLNKFGIDRVLLLVFNRYLAEHSAASFIERIRQFIPFSFLVLGHDATLGRDRQGNRAVMEHLGKQWGFKVLYQEEYRFEGQPVSSTRIRNALQQGDLNTVEQLLDRPYSIYNFISPGMGKGRQIGYATANIDVENLCLPPYGVYAVEVLKEGKKLQGVANLGIAPTIRTDGKPILEVHLFDHAHDLYGLYLEVIFKSFIRPEYKFNNPEELRQQIEHDIQMAKKSFAQNHETKK